MVRIVVGIDGSAPSLVAHEFVAGTTWPRPTTVRLVASHDVPMDWATHVPGGDWFAEVDGAARTELMRRMDALAEELRRVGMVPEVHLARGPAAIVLIDQAREWASDLIVVGNRGRGPRTSALLGSVSASVADHAPCPVLVVRQPRATRMLLAVDGSPSATAIPQVLRGWSGFRQLPVDVVSVAQPTPRADAGFVTAWATSEPAPAPLAVRNLAEHRDLATAVAGRMRAAGWDASASTRVGDPADEILRAAHDLGADLIVTGSRGLGDLQRLLVGSVAHEVLLRASQSVLVVRGHVAADIARRPVALAGSQRAPAG